MKKLNLYLFVLLIIGGCSVFLPKNSKKIDKQIYLLTNDSVKYWCNILDNSSFNSEQAGIAFLKNGNLLIYEYNNNNKRIYIDPGSEDIICDTSKFNINSNKLYVEKCGYTFVFKIEKLTSNSLKLKEITNYGFYPNDISPHFIISKDQKSKPIIDSTDYSNSGPFYLVPK